MDDVFPGSTDPCYNYTVLDAPWRLSNFSDTHNWKSDVYFTWVGWYRLMYQGLDIQMSESCVEIYMCGTYAPLWMYGGHPQRLDGVVTRQICGKWYGDCCYFKSYPIRVKACQGNYYVYEIVKPAGYDMGYCADVTTLKPPVDHLIEIKYFAGLVMSLSSVEDLTQSSTSGIFLKECRHHWKTAAPVNISKDCSGVVPNRHGVTQNGSGSSSVTSPTLVLVEKTNESVCGGTVVSTKMNDKYLNTCQSAKILALKDLLVRL
ncbi:hypothetical protein NFI96_016190 [Prochilodus magdalenae]|nr:hypothetical protein NFI96_016190 [Prochilodus magdalenae]